MSKRKRDSGTYDDKLTKIEYDKYLKRAEILVKGGSANDNSHIYSEVDTANSSSHPFGDDSLSDVSDPPYVCSKLVKDVASFVVRRSMPVNHVNELLHIFNENDVANFPKSHKKLMNTVKERIETRTISNGSFVYFGISVGLKKKKVFLENTEHVVIDIGIDGAQLFNSSHLAIWPIMGSIVNLPNVKPFLIGNFMYSVILELILLWS